MDNYTGDYYPIDTYKGDSNYPTREEFNQFKEKCFCKHEQDNEELVKLNKKTDEFYKNNNNMRREVNDILNIVNSFKEKTLEIYNYVAAIDKILSALVDRVKRLETDLSTIKSNTSSNLGEN